MARLLIAGLLAAAAITPALAQPAPPIAPAPMMRAGPMAATLNRAEVSARVQKHFARRDANRDGVLTSDELNRRGQRMAGRARTMRDPNAAFDRIDANRDGRITRDEFASARQVRVQRIVVNRGGQPGALRGLRRGGGMMGMAMLKRADLNRDGRVTLAEANGAAMQHFDMIDTNRDGRITPQERAAGRAHMMHMRQAG